MTPIDTKVNIEGTAKNPVYNTSALLWVGLVGLPVSLFLMLLFKLHLI